MSPTADDKRRARGRANHFYRRRRRPCEVCGAPAQMHHEDYWRALEVRWLCYRHHLEAEGKVDHSLTLPLTLPTGDTRQAVILREVLERLEHTDVACARLGETQENVSD